MRVLYESQGELVAVKTLGPIGEEQVFIWEGFRTEDEFMEPRGVFRSFRLDPSTGGTQVSWERAVSKGPWGWADQSIAVSQDGLRVAQIEGDSEMTGSRVWVADAVGKWTPIGPFDSRFRLLPRWSLDGDALAYLAFTFTRSGLGARDAVALSMARPAEASEEVVLTPEGHVSNEVAWAADGQSLYLLSAQPEAGEHLEAVEWPSLHRRTVFSGAGLRCLSVASQTGDLVFLARADSEAAEDDSGTPVWRLSQAGNLQKTPVAHTGALPPHAISPDGSRLAVVPRAEGQQYGRGLMVYSLADGTAETFDALKGTTVRCINWVFGGRAVLAVDGDEKVWLIAVEGDLPEAAPVDLRPPVIASFPPDPDQRSRNNLRKLNSALLNYVTEHDCMFPDLGDMDAVAEALRPYIEDDDVFLDPRTMQPYGANPSFSGKCHLDPRGIPDAVVFYETTPGDDGGRDVILRFSGAQHVTPERWEELKKLSGIE